MSNTGASPEAQARQLLLSASKNHLRASHSTAQSQNSALDLPNAFEFTSEIHLVTRLNIDALHTHGRTLGLGQRNYVFNINSLHLSQLPGACPSSSAPTRCQQPLEKEPRWLWRPSLDPRNLGALLCFLALTLRRTLLLT